MAPCLWSILLLDDDVIVYHKTPFNDLMRTLRVGGNSVTGIWLSALQNSNKTKKLAIVCYFLQNVIQLLKERVLFMTFTNCRQMALFAFS